VTAPNASKWKVWHIDAVGAGTFAVLTGIAVLVVVMPVVRKQTDHAALRADVAQQRQLAAQFDESERLLRRELEAVQEELASSQLHLQPTMYLNTRMALIVEVASATGIVIDETRSGTVKVGPRYQTVPIHLSGTGSYSDSASFLHQLHLTLPDTGVVGLELSGKPDKPDTPATFRFDLIWYAAPARAAVPP